LAFHSDVARYRAAVTVVEVIQRSTDFLARKGVASPRLNVELLMAHVLGMPRLQLYLNFDRLLQEKELTAARDLIRQRGNRTPLQHLVGSTSFCGWDLRVGPDVLIPRPETEQLVERALEFLQRRTGRGERPWTVLDFGTGSGCIAVALAKGSSATRVVGCDVAAAALRVAAGNVAAHGLTDRVSLVLSDKFSALQPGERFDLIVSNPPYIPTPLIAQLDPEVRDHDPRLALDGGTDGLAFYRVLAADAPAFLRSEGRMLLELGDGQAGEVRAVLEGQKWVVEAEDADYSGRIRFLRARHQSLLPAGARESRSSES
jgi:release factor glutamine methyltransferase